MLMGKSVGDWLQAPSVPLVLEIQHTENVLVVSSGEPALMIATMSFKKVFVFTALSIILHVGD